MQKQQLGNFQTEKAPDEILEIVVLGSAIELTKMSNSGPNGDGGYINGQNYTRA